MDAKIFNGMRGVVHKGEQMAPLSSVKMKVKFQKPEVEEAKDKLSKKMKKQDK